METVDHRIYEIQMMAQFFPSPEINFVKTFRKFFLSFVKNRQHVSIVCTLTGWISTVAYFFFVRTRVNKIEIMNGRSRVYVTR